MDSSHLDVTFICKEIGMSRASLYNKLKALTDMGANDYINKFRMEKAITLITSTALSFTEIAEKVGFTTSRYFSTAFKQYTGETPTQYKEKQKQERKKRAIRSYPENKYFLGTDYTDFTSFYSCFMITTIFKTVKSV